MNQHEDARAKLHGLEHPVINSIHPVELYVWDLKTNEILV